MSRATWHDGPWPFTVSRGILGCTQPPFPGAVTFNVGGTVYAVNGTAEDAGHQNIDPIWNPAGGGLRVDIGRMIDKGLSLCPGGNSDSGTGSQASASVATATHRAEKPGGPAHRAPYSGVAPETNGGPATDQSVCPGAQVITVDPNTSCPFARHVAAVVDAAHHATGHFPANVTAFSPVTGKTYRLRCVITGPNTELLCATPAPATGIVVLPFRTSIASPSAPTTPQSAPAPQPASEGPGSTSHAADAEFCSTHGCIANFPNGNGYVVQCADGEWSHSGGLSGACSDHGGES